VEIMITTGTAGAPCTAGYARTRPSLPRGVPRPKAVPTVRIGEIEVAATVDTGRMTTPAG